MNQRPIIVLGSDMDESQRLRMALDEYMPARAIIFKYRAEGLTEKDRLMQSRTLRKITAQRWGIDESTFNLAVAQRIP